MAKVKLRCGVYGEGSVFSVDIERDADVEALQEKIAGILSTEQHTVPPRLLTLYLARKKEGDESKWLKDDHGVKNFLQAGKSAEYEEMRPSWILSEDYEDYLGANFQPGRKEIHVLVELPETQEAAVANKKQRLEWRSTRRRSHAYDPNSQYFLLEKEDIDESGLPPVRSMLYCRPTFHRQFEFLRDKVLNEGHLGWILGPPGTGKSTTAMAFALTLNRSEWIVTWIHVSKFMDWQCVRLIGDERKTRTLETSDVDEVLMVEDKRHHVVLVDGWIPADQFIELTRKCVRWFSHSNGVKQRRLAFVCSVAARGKVDEDSEFVTRAVEFPVWSWTLDEYLNAIKDDEMFQSVSQCLDVPGVLPDEEMSRVAMVESKYYYAGGSCRYMFGFGTVSVLEKLSFAVDSLENATTHATSGQRSSSSINRLHAMFQRPHGVGAVSPLISQYAATRIGAICGPEVIKKFMSTHRDSSNPALNGWMLEMVFFASLRKGGLALVDAAGNTVGTWGPSEIVVADGIPALSSADPVWIKPDNWSQGGYDAIMVCRRTQHVRLVQVTSADKHSFRIEYFYEWLKMLSESPESFEVKTLEIFFVVEQDKLSAFKFTTVTGDGLLQPFGWPKGEEIERVRLAGIRGLYNLSQ